MELPTFMSELVFNALGYNMVKHPDGPPYYKFENKSGLEHPDYGKMCKGKIVIYVNLSSGYSFPFICVRQDADTRTVFNGVVENMNHLKTILKLIR